MTETSNGSTVGIDISNPSINSLMEGFDNLDPKYYNNSDTITLYWSQDDAISGIRETYYGLGTQPNTTDLMSWTLGETNNFGGWNNLELENEINTMALHSFVIQLGTILIPYGEMVFILIQRYQFQGQLTMDNGFLKWIILRTQHF